MHRRAFLWYMAEHLSDPPGSTARPPPHLALNARFWARTAFFAAIYVGVVLCYYFFLVPRVYRVPDDSANHMGTISKVLDGVSELIVDFVEKSYQSSQVRYTYMYKSTHPSTHSHTQTYHRRSYCIQHSVWHGFRRFPS